MKPLSFEIPGAPPLLLNSRLHWRTLHNERARWKARVGGVVIPLRPHHPYDKVFIRYTRFCGYAEPDHDNLVSGFKWIQDALVEYKIILNDTPTVIVGKEYLWQKCSPRFKRILIEIRPPEAAETSQSPAPS